MLKERVLTAYQELEFHVIYQDVNSFCTVEMSSFYLDILKDRMYTSKADSLERPQRPDRHARHPGYPAAPAGAGTYPSPPMKSGSIMPGNTEESVHLAEFPVLNPEWKNDALVARWDRIIKVRSDVSKALELARVAKIIGHSLDAAVTITAQPELLGFLREYENELQSIFIVSKAVTADEIAGESWASENVEGLKIQVTAAPGVKCERCWCYSEELGTDAGHPTICPKCTGAVL